MEIKLTKEQQKHVKTLRWLYSGPRGSGRTMLLAYMMIEAVLTTKQEMRIIDHHPQIHADVYLSRIIADIIDKNELPLEVSRSQLRLKYKD